MYNSLYKNINKNYFFSFKVLYFVINLSNSICRFDNSTQFSVTCLKSF